MSDATVDVAIENVWKQYRLSTSRNARTFWALQDVSLNVLRGASVGVIGRNGAGKSTLLKLLAGITAPTRGRIVIHGRVAALIEVGSGFHPELTGRENVFLSGAILGMRRREIAGKLERIVEFAGVRQFIDTPVKWYSSGMYVRLGFAVAAHMEPDILLVDEVLAVGDAEFQVKCLQRIQELKNQGTTSLLISHDLTAVERLCDSAVLLEAGTIAATGSPRGRRRQLPSSTGIVGPPVRRDVARFTQERRGADQPHVPTIRTNRKAVSFNTGEPLTVSLRYAAAKPIPNVEFELRYYSADGKTRIASPRTGEHGEPVHLKPPGGVIEFTCAALPLKPGSYSIGAVVRDVATLKILAWWDGETRLYVRSGPATDGQFYIPHSWRVVHADDESGCDSESGR